MSYSQTTVFYDGKFHSVDYYFSIEQTGKNDNYEEYVYMRVIRGRTWKQTFTLIKEFYKFEHTGNYVLHLTSDLSKTFHFLISLTIKREIFDIEEREIWEERKIVETYLEKDIFLDKSIFIFLKKIKFLNHVTIFHDY